MDKQHYNEYIIEIKLFNFKKGSIIDDIDININNNKIFSLIEAIKSKNIKSFGNTLIVNEIFLNLSPERVHIDMIVKIKDLGEEKYLVNLTAAELAHHIVNMKALSVDLNFKPNHLKKNIPQEEINNKKTGEFLDILLKENINEEENSVLNGTTDNSSCDKNIIENTKINNSNLIKEFENINKKISHLELINKIQNEKLKRIENLYLNQSVLIESEKSRIDKIEKNMHQLRMIASPLTIKYIFEYLISLAHKKFNFAYRESISHSNKLNDILESIYYFIEGPNLISEDVDMNFLNNIPLEAKNILLSKKGNLRPFLKSIQDLYDYLHNVYFFNDVRNEKLYYDKDIFYLVNFLNILIGNIVNLE